MNFLGHIVVKRHDSGNINMIAKTLGFMTIEGQKIFPGRKALVVLPDRKPAVLKCSFDRSKSCIRQLYNSSRLMYGRVS